MGMLLAATNIYFNAMCAFLAVMIIVGFCLMRTDRKRWKAQEMRSQQMMDARKKKPQEGEDAAAADDAGKKGKKKAKKEKKAADTPFEYQPRVPDKALFAVGIFFGAIGELFAMIIYRHKWHEFAYRTYMPILAVGNILVAGVVLVLLYMRGDGSVVWTIGIGG